MQKTSVARWLISIAGVDFEEKIFVVGWGTASTALSFHGRNPTSAAVPHVEQFCLNHWMHL
jgi:hypothetical protein